MVATQPLLPAFTSNEKLAATIKLSNFRPENNVTADRVKWSVSVNGREICSGAGAAGVALDQGSVKTVGVISCSLPDAGGFLGQGSGGPAAGGALRSAVIV